MINLLISILRGANLTDQIENIKLLKDCKLTISGIEGERFVYYTSSLYGYTSGVLVYGVCDVDANGNIIIPQSAQSANISISPTGTLSTSCRNAYVRPFLKVK